MTTLTAAPTLTRTIHAPASQVYSAFTNQDWLHDWLCDEAHVRGAVGGHILLFWYPARHAVGQYTALEPDKHVALTLRYADSVDDIDIEITIDADGDVTEITLTGTFDAVLQEQWDNALNNLQSVLETGADLRITERVLIGIYPGNFDAEVAKKLNVPVTEGNLVNDVLPGLGAHKAGLQANDVVVEIDGKSVNADNPIYTLVRPKKPGDTVEVGYYRSGEKQTVTMPLSGYPLPEFPADYAGLADQIEEVYAALDQEMTALFEGVSEAEAAQRPEPNEWSANEVLAHLILNERWLQSWLGGLMQAPEISGYTANTPARIAGVVNTYKNGLQDEMRRSWAETIAILRAVPEEFRARKGNLWWATFELHQSPVHTRQHYTQIRNAIEAARK